MQQTSNGQTADLLGRVLSLTEKMAHVLNYFCAFLVGVNRPEFRKHPRPMLDPGPEKMAQENNARVAVMDNHLFNRLAESMTQMDEIVRGERQPSREFHVDAAQVKLIRKATGLAQSAFAESIGVALGTLRNWEQGRRDPEGPAKALLRAIHNDPTNVIAALIHREEEHP